VLTGNEWVSYHLSYTETTTASSYLNHIPASTSMSLARKRTTARAESPSLPQAVQRPVSEDDKVSHVCSMLPRRHSSWQRRQPIPPLHYKAVHREHLQSYAAALVLTVLAFAVRFWRISHPDQVVFDEVHFGSFASHYIRREYYFDVHPPLAKMLNGLAGWWIGYDGTFGFSSIGDNYTKNEVPYVGLRSFCAIMGSITVPLVYAIMRESGYPVGIAAFSAALILFGTSRLT